MQDKRGEDEELYGKSSGPTFVLEANKNTMHLGDHGNLYVCSRQISPRVTCNMQVEVVQSAEIEDLSRHDTVWQSHTYVVVARKRAKSQQT